MAQTESFTCLCQLQPGILQEEKCRQDVAGEAAVLAQQTAFALGERSNMGSLLLSLVTDFQVPPLNAWVLASPKVKSQVCIYVF